MILEPDRETYGHLAIALRRHQQWAARQSVKLPSAWSELQQAFTSRASEGQGGTTVDDLWKFAESRSITPLLITYEEGAHMLGCSTRQLKRLVQDGALSPVRIGASPRLRVADVTEYVQGLPTDKEAS